MLELDRLPHRQAMVPIPGPVGWNAFHSRSQKICCIEVPLAHRYFFGDLWMSIPARQISSVPMVCLDPGLLGNHLRSRHALVEQTNPYTGANGIWQIGVRGVHA